MDHYSDPAGTESWHMQIRWETNSKKAGTWQRRPFVISQQMMKRLRWVVTSSLLTTPLRYLERERTEGRKREKFYICLDVTHTHPARAGSTLKGKRKKKADTRRADGQKQRRGGGETDLTKTAHTPKPHDTLRRGTRGKLGTKWGTSWWQTRKPKQLVKQQDSVPRPRIRALRHSRPVVNSCPNRHITAAKFHRIRCTICFTSPENQKERIPYLQVVCLPYSNVVTWCKMTLQKLLQERRFLNVQHGFPVTELYSTRFHKGPQDQRDTQKTVQNGKASCYTLLKWITRLKCKFGSPVSRHSP